MSCTIVLSVSVTCCVANLSQTETGRAFCCFSFGSLFLRARYCLDRRMLSSLSLSVVGFHHPDDRKVCTTFDMVSLTVPSASMLNHELENLPLLVAMANAPSKRILSCLLRLSMKMSCHPTERRYSSHLAHAQDLLSCFLPVVACSWVSAAEVKSAKS